MNEMPREIWAYVTEDHRCCWISNNPGIAYRTIKRAKYIRADTVPDTQPLSDEGAQLLEFFRLLNAAYEDRWVDVHLRWMVIGGEWQISANSLRLTPTFGDFTSLPDAIAELRSRLKPEKPTAEEMARAIDAALRDIADGNTDIVLAFLRHIRDAWEAYEKWEREHDTE